MRTRAVIALVTAYLTLELTIAALYGRDLISRLEYELHPPAIIFPVTDPVPDPSPFWTPLPCSAYVHPQGTFCRKATSEHRSVKAP